MTDAEDLRDARNAFVQWDTNQDGVLSMDEIREHMAEICQYFNMEEPNVLRILKAADTDGDGQIDYTEFLTAAFDKKKLLSQENLKRVFQTLDHDGNGYVSKDEIQMLLGTDDVQNAEDGSTNLLDDFINEMDKDNDGQVDFDEFNEHMQGVLEKRASLYIKRD